MQNLICSRQIAGLVLGIGQFAVSMHFMTTVLPQYHGEGVSEVVTQHLFFRINIKAVFSSTCVRTNTQWGVPLGVGFVAPANKNPYFCEVVDDRQVIPHQCPYLAVLGCPWLCLHGLCSPTIWPAVKRKGRAQLTLGMTVTHDWCQRRQCTT